MKRHASGATARGAAWWMACIAALSAIACAEDGRAQVATDAGGARAPEGTTMKTVTIPVEGMSCASCAGRVKNALADLDGVVETEVRLTEREARVRYAAEKVTAERIASTIAALGYQVGAPKQVD